MVINNDCQVVELGPGASSEPERHIYEESVYILSGRGATSVWIDENRKQTFEWAKAASSPSRSNAWYQHFNGSGTEPVRYLAVTTAPTAMRQYRNLDFIFNNPFAFEDRFDSEDGYFNGEGKLYQARIWETNFVPTRRQHAAPLVEGARGRRHERDAGAGQEHHQGAHFRVPRGHLQEGPSPRSGAHLVLLGGVGFSLLWQEGQEPRQCNWKRGSLVVVPTEGCFPISTSTRRHTRALPGAAPRRHTGRKRPAGRRRRQHQGGRHPG